MRDNPEEVDPNGLPGGGHTLQPRDPTSYCWDPLQLRTGPSLHEDIANGKY